MRILRGLALSLLLVSGIVGAGLWAGARWLESPSGSAWLSRQVTRRLQASAPGSEIQLEGLRVSARMRRGLRAEIARVVWRRSGGQELAEVRPLEAHLRLTGWPPRLVWEAQGEVRRLDLAGLDRTLARGRWRASGGLAGPVRLGGEGAQVRSADLRLETLQPGGDLSSELLQGLVAMMPAGDTRAALLQALAGRALFHFHTGQVEMVTEPERYVLHLRVDGDHLLDIQVRVPKESIELLEQLFL